jgi:hypothetical protein
LAAVNNALQTLLNLLVQLGDLVMAGIVACELWLRGELTLLHVPRPIQTVLMVALAVLLIVAALRLFGGLIRVAVVVVLLLIALHVLLPIIQT